MKSVVESQGEARMLQWLWKPREKRAIKQDGLQYRLMKKGIVLVSQGYCNKVPNIRWFKTADSYFFTDLEARTILSLTTLGRNSFFPLLACDVREQPLAFLGLLVHHSSHMASLSLYVFPLSFLCTCLSLCPKCSFYKDTSPYQIKFHPHF